MSIALEILLSYIDGCRHGFDKLAYSLNKNYAFFPLTVVAMASLSLERKASIGMFFLRYSQFAALTQDLLCRGIAIIELGHLNVKFNRIKVLLMEKLGSTRSTDKFCTAALFPNKLAQHYSKTLAGSVLWFNLVDKEGNF